MLMNGGRLALDRLELKQKQCPSATSAGVQRGVRINVNSVKEEDVGLPPQAPCTVSRHLPQKRTRQCFHRMMRTQASATPRPDQDPLGHLTLH